LHGEDQVTALPETELELGANLANRPATEFPPGTFATAFADGVSAYVRGPGVVKFFLYRVDPNMFGRGGSVSNPFAQIVMPNEAFVRMVTLFNRAVKAMIKSGEITQERIDDMDKALDIVNAKLGNPLDGQ
jgi:hypothetical protein